jgi:sugar phosphate isomerase/epimerase
MRWAINQITLNGGRRRPPADLARDLAALRAGGWTALEVWLPHWDGDVARLGLPGARRVLDDSGLIPAGGCGAEPFFFATGAARGAAFDRLRLRLEQCQALGAPHLVVAPGFGALEAPAGEAFDRAAENLAAAGDLAAGYGVRLGVECLAAAHLVRSQSGAIALARRAARPAVGVLLDTYHLYAGVSKLSDLDTLRDEPSLLTMVHVSDVSGERLHELWTVGDRDLPFPDGRGAVPNAAMLRTVRDLGYDGFLSLELFSAAFEDRWRADPLAAAAVARRRCHALTDGLGWPATVAPGGAP